MLQDGFAGKRLGAFLTVNTRSNFNPMAAAIAAAFSVLIITTEEPSVCYHCEEPIAAGSRAALFAVVEGYHEEGEEGAGFIMHETCAAWRCYPEDVSKDNRF